MIDGLRDRTMVNIKRSAVVVANSDPRIKTHSFGTSGGVLTSKWAVVALSFVAVIVGGTGRRSTHGDFGSRARSNRGRTQRRDRSSR